MTTKTNMNPWWLLAGVVIAGSAVALGAFGAHGLKNIISASALTTYEIGVKYQMYHGLAIVALPALVGFIAPKWLNRVAGVFVLGCVLFSGSLYLLAITGNKLWGPITPLGGVLFIVGWCVLAWQLIGGATKGRTHV